MPPLCSEWQGPFAAVRGSSLRASSGWIIPASPSAAGLKDCWSPTESNVFVLFFFKEISKNGNKVKTESHYSDESEEQKEKPTTGKKHCSPFP